MIGFQINGEFLDLPENPSVELNRNSPIFQQDGFVVEDYTLPITFPNTPKNSRLLGWPHIVENAARLRPKWTCIMWYNGVPRLKGELRAKKPINTRSISANFVKGISQIGEDLKERSLRDIIDESITIHSLNITKSIILNWIPATSARCAIIINGVSFEGVDMDELVSNINADTELTATASNSSNQLTITSDISGEFEPFQVDIPEDSDYVMLAGTPSWLNSYKTAYENYVAEHVGSGRFLKAVRFGTFANFFQSDEEFPLKLYPVGNLYGPDGFAVNVVKADLYNNPITNNINSMAPMVTLKYVLEKIAEHYDITIDFPALDPDDVFFHSFTLDRPINFLGSKKLILFERSFSLNQLVPDIKINDFLKALQIGSNSQMKFDGDARILSITNRGEIMETREYLDITEHCALATDIQLSTKRGLKFALAKDGGDTIDTATVYPVDYIIGEGEREITVGFGTAPMKDHEMQNYWPGYFSYGTTPNYTVAIKQTFESNFSFRIVRYKEETFKDPYLESTPFLWEGDNGLFETYWKSSVEMENNPVTIVTRWLMTREQAFNLDWEQKLRIDRNDFLLKSFNVSLQRNGLSMAECQFIKVPFFSVIEKPVITYAWRGVESSKYCERTIINWKEFENNGNAGYYYIEQYIVETGEATGTVKFNSSSDPDYIAPFEDLDMCPLNIGTADIGKLYISSEAPLSTNDRVYINNVEYDFSNFPYPHTMGDYTAVRVEFSNNTTDTFKFTVKSLVGNTITNTKTLTVYPGNVVNTDFGKQTSSVFRSLSFTTLLGDFDKGDWNRLQIVREII
jgi:hypothetical protein